MILHFLASYSTAQMMMLFGGLGFFLINTFSLIGGLTSDDQNLITASYGGMLWGGCFAAANLLRHRPNSDGLMITFTLIGSVGIVCWIVFRERYRKARRASRLMPKTAASENVWPPPPTSHGG